MASRTAITPRVEVTARGLQEEALTALLVSAVEAIQHGEEGGLLDDLDEIADVLSDQVFDEGASGLQAIPSVGYAEVTVLDLFRDHEGGIRICVYREPATDVYVDSAPRSETAIDTLLDDLVDGLDDGDAADDGRPEVVRCRPGRPRRSR